MKKKPVKRTSLHTITKDMLIGEVISAYPSTAEVLLSAGIHCVGCGAAAAESLEEGLASHGKTAMEIGRIVTALNESIPEEIRLGKLSITRPAAKKLAFFLKHAGKKRGLRITVKEEGPPGHAYAFGLETKKRKDDCVFTTHGATLYIGKASMDLLAGKRIDYVKTPRMEGFRIHTPKKR